MTRPDFTGIRPDVAEYITSLEQDTAQKQQELGQRDERIAQLETRVADIMQMLQNLQRLYFGRKSEKIRIPAMEDGAVQLSIFSQEEKAPVPQSVEPETIEVSGHKRKKKRTQEEIIADLPVVIHEHKIPQDQLSCPRCGNEVLEYIGRELVYTEYVRVPAHVDRHDHYVENMPATLAKKAPTHVNPVNALARKPARPVRTNPGQSSLLAICLRNIGTPS